MILSGNLYIIICIIHYIHTFKSRFIGDCDNGHGHRSINQYESRKDFSFVQTKVKNIIIFIYFWTLNPNKIWRKLCKIVIYVLTIYVLQIEWNPPRYGTVVYIQYTWCSVGLLSTQCCIVFYLFSNFFNQLAFSLWQGR